MASSALLLVAFLSAGAALARPPDNKIVGGQEVNISSVPWQVALLSSSYHACGGTIISPHWILSAAHCTQEQNPSMLSVRVGSNKHASGGKVYQIEMVLNHEDVIDYFHHDISLLKTRSPIEFSDNVAAALLPQVTDDDDDDALDVGTVLTVSGWGRTDRHHSYPDDLYAVDVELVDFAECAERFSQYNPDKNLHLCAGSGGRSSCHGDSGGPLVHGKRVVGIVSYGNVTHCDLSPAVYTKVSAYTGWIKDKTGL